MLDTLEIALVFYGKFYVATSHTVHSWERQEKVKVRTYLKGKKQLHGKANATSLRAGD